MSGSTYILRMEGIYTTIKLISQEHSEGIVQRAPEARKKVARSERQKELPNERRRRGRRLPEANVRRNCPTSAGGAEEGCQKRTPEGIAQPAPEARQKVVIMVDEKKGGLVP